MRLPQTVGSYRLVERLGAGSFGSVYRGEVLGALGFSQDVAVKILDPARAIERPDLIASLADEAVLLSRLQHPNIVQVRGLERIEHDFLGTTYAMVMELVRGIPLRRLIDASGERGALIPAQASLLLLSEAADALAYAHDMEGSDGANVGFVHRDMKPGNVLVTREGRLKILDFGIALAADRQVTSTAAGMTKGTVLYMSPEQVRGLPLEGRSDVYSLGLIFYELLTGELFIPLPDGGLADLAGILAAVADVTWADRVGRLREVLRAEPPRGHGLSEEQADALEGLLEEMLRLQPLERATAGRVVELLDELGRGWQIKRGRGHLRDLVRAEYETFDEIPAMRPEGGEVVLGDPGPTLDGRVPGAKRKDVAATRILPSANAALVPEDVSDVPELEPGGLEPKAGAPVGGAPVVGVPRAEAPTRGAPKAEAAKAEAPAEATKRRGPSPGVLVLLAGLLMLVIGFVLMPEDDVQRADDLPPLSSPTRPAGTVDLAAGLVLDGPAEAGEDGEDAQGEDQDGEDESEGEDGEDGAGEDGAREDEDGEDGEADAQSGDAGETDDEPTAAPTRRPAPARKPPPRREPAPSPTPAPVASVEPEAETPAPPVGKAQVKLIHDPPPFVVPGAPLALSVLTEVAGGGEVCAPRVILAPQGKRKYRRYPMSAAGGGRYTATIDIPYDDLWADGVRYFVECCWGPDCDVRWRGPGSPHVLGPPEF